MKKFILIFVLLNAVFVLQAQNLKNDTTTTTLKGDCGNKTFYEKNLKLEQNYFKSLPKPKLKFNNKWWKNIIFIIALLFITFLSVKFSEEITLIIKSFFNRIYMRHILTVQQNTLSNLLIIFNIFFFIISSIFFYFVLRQIVLPIKISDYILFFSVFSVLVLFFLLKLLSAKLWNFLFEDENFYPLFITNIRLSNSIESIFLLFFFFIIFFNPVFGLKWYVFGFLIFLIGFIIRSYNMIREYFNKGFLLFYLILYLCTVEIFPILLLLKFVSTK